MGCLNICGFLMLSLILRLLIPSSVHSSDITTHVESLTIPFAERYPKGDATYARNVWDLQVFEGRLYIGAGNYDNEGPAPNAGPVPILALDPVSGAVVREGEADDEEISRFEVIDGKLFIPGADARESWKLGNLYRREADGQWLKLRTIPRAIHVSALTGHFGRMYAGLKATDTVPWYVDFKGYGSAVAVSGDNGVSWKFLPLGGYGINAFLNVAGHIYAIDVFPGPGIERWISAHGRKNYYAPIYELNPSDEGFVRRPDLTAEQLFPDTQAAKGCACVINRSARFKNSAIYIGSGAHGPFGLYRADSLAMQDIRTTHIPLPEETIPRDILVCDETAFVLLEGPVIQKGIQVIVLASRDMKQWANILQFCAPTFARSFELLNGDFYFGLGCEVKNRSDWHQEELHPETGRLLRIKGKYVTKF